MDIKKRAETAAAGPVSEEELEEINRFARRPLRAEEVYTFTLRLCDNQVDRDFERFDEKCLEELGGLFVGKSGLFDHRWSAQGQSARLYRTEVVRETERCNEDGSPYCWLKGWAYMLRTEKNAELIAEIEGGIKREVSVGCSVGKRTCSLCGKAECDHVPGQRYGGRLCYVTLSEAKDAYEWSFVAVPAQKEAGVVRKGQRTPLKAFLEQAGQTELQEELGRLEKEAQMGRNYLRELRREVVRLAALADEELDGAVFAGIAERLDETELLELRRVYRKRLDGSFNGVQLGQGRREELSAAFMV